jgi:superfamily II DNA or RNA helicase
MLGVVCNGCLLNKSVGYAVFRRTWSGTVRRRNLATIANFVGLPSPSPEQELVIKALKQGRNARVNAVAGSGKTTTILQVARALPDRKILGSIPVDS